MVTPEVFVPIEHPPGAEVQIDWGQADVILNGEVTRVMLFCARLPYSKATFVRAYMREDQPSFLDAHIHLIEYLRGVPNTFAYDNLKSAVTQVVGRERSLNQKFLELRSHYLFQTRFCNVAKGNEKGHTENSVKRAQRSYLTPLPSVTSIDQLNAHLKECVQADLRRIDTPSGKNYGERLETERSHFASPPATPFIACVNRAARVDRYATVQFEEVRYSVPCKYACLHSVVRVGIDTVEIIIGNEIVATHRRGVKGQWVLQMEHYLPVLQRKPGLLDSGKPFAKTQFTDAERLMRQELEYRYAEEGTRQFLDILMLSKKHDFGVVREAITNCVAARAFHEEAVRLELHRLQQSATTRASAELDLSSYPELQNVQSKTRDLSIYDTLIGAPDSINNELLLPLSDSTQWSATDDNQTTTCETKQPTNREELPNIAPESDNAAESRERLKASPATNVLGRVFIALCGVFA
jgi:hypothetical protein